MKIAIIGTRGIPNNYGGFEQLAEYLSLGLKEKGHDVYVYNSSKHIYREKTWKGIHIIHQPDPEKKIGTAGQFIYDLNCILNTRKHHFDAILNLGYTSSSVWMKLFPKRSRIITNMDGLEWKRTKYSKKVQSFLLFAEKLAVKGSDVLVADSLAIQAYLLKKYDKLSNFIAYGADLFDTPDDKILIPFKVMPFQYNMLIARMEPENNIETILEGVYNSTSERTFFVIGNSKNKFGSYLMEKYQKDPRIVFTGPIYDTAIINNLRYFSNLYFHGHSVGGTNPSLLEAMGCRCLIAAHSNEFNKSVLGNDAFYFNDSKDITTFTESVDKTTEANKTFMENNYRKIKTEYSWSKIVSQYEQIMINK
jgi:glycosyltransferase involved in cell wall biosynthesis